jgi:hypothetical protein
MTNIATSTTADAIQRARAAHLRDLFEPWSLRRLEARTGIGRGVLETRLKGATALTMADIEILAPVIRMTPQELFSELLAITPDNKKGPASEETGRMLPHLDSNQEPAGFRTAQIAPVIPIERVAKKAHQPESHSQVNELNPHNAVVIALHSRATVNA